MAKVSFNRDAKSAKPLYETDPDWDELFHRECDWRLEKAVQTAIRLSDTAIAGYKQQKLIKQGQR